MKKRLIAAIFLALLFLALFVCPEEIAYAEEEGEIENKLEEEINREISGLDISELEGLFAEIDRQKSQKFGSSVFEVIRKIIDGEADFSFNLIFETAISELKDEFLGFLPSFLSIIIIAVLYGIFNGLTSGFAKESTGKIIYFVCYGAVVCIMTIALSDAITTVKNTLTSINRLSDGVFPIMLTLTTALGGTASVAVFQPYVVFFSTVMIKIINIVVFPLFFASVIFKIVGNLSDNLSLNKLSSTAKSASDWILGGIFSLFTVFLTVQGVTGASFDTIGVKSAKFALSSYVPILGGYLSEGFDLVMASCIMIKNAVGLCGIVLLFLIVFAPVIKIVTLIFAMRITSGIVEIVGDKKFSELIYGVSKSLTVLISILLGLGFLLFIIIMLIICSCNFGVL